MSTSPVRSLFLVAYDIADSRRLSRVHRFLLGYKVGGQKSFYECWLTDYERAAVVSGLLELIDPVEDRVHIFQLDPRMTPRCFGVAVPFRDSFFTIT